ncbi:MAG TPA: VTT domain-containing protein [Dehalococcoidia bacterium]
MRQGEESTKPAGTSAWLTGIPLGALPRWATIAIGTSLVVGFTLLGFAAWVFDWLDEETMEDLGYLGIFISNFLPHVSVFLPLPGLTAVGHALIIWGAEELNPVIVVAIATFANTIAEWTSYLAGSTGKAAAEERPISVPGVAGRWLGRSWALAEWFMARAGFMTLLVLSAIPNPVFEVTGIIAGATRMNFLKFNVALLIGHFIRVMFLVIVGHEAIEWVGL